MESKPDSLLSKYFFFRTKFLKVKIILDLKLCSGGDIRPGSGGMFAVECSKRGQWDRRKAWRKLRKRTGQGRETLQIGRDGTGSGSSRRSVTTEEG